jgi:hypothetical protein
VEGVEINPEPLELQRQRGPAEWPELVGAHRPALGLHRLKQAGDGRRVEPVRADEGAERRPVQTRGVEHRLALGRAGEAVEQCQEVAHEAGGCGARIPVVGEVGGDQPGQPLGVVPVRRGRPRRLPLRPGRLDRVPGAGF